MSEPSRNPDEFQRLDALLPRLTEGSLTRPETEELAKILESSTEAQSRYLTYLQLHSELGSLFGSGSPADISIADQLPQAAENGSTLPMVTLRQKPPWGMSSFSSGLVACLLMIIGALSLLLILQLKRPHDGNQIQEDGPAVAQSPGASDGEGQNAADERLLESHERRHIFSRPNPDAAVIVRADGLSGTNLAVGTRLKPGRIELEHESVQMEFMCGAVLAFAGPGKLDIHSKDAATLISGSISAQVPERARGFVLNAPNAAIVDLGTEFSVNVNLEGKSEVEVISGLVELSLLGSDGNTLTSRRVHESTRMRVDDHDKSFTLLDSVESLPAKIIASDESGLPINDQYVNEIIDSEPIIYCRFEDSQDGLISNEMSKRFSVQADPPESLGKSIRISNGHVRFSRDEASRSLIVDDPIADLNEGPYTIEFWMKPDDLQHATCLAVFPESRTDIGQFLNVVEIVTDTFMIHEPGALRFLHRSPPGTLAEQGTNAFTPGMCVPGQWHHLVAVKTHNSMAIYVNGHQIRSIELEEGNANGAGEFRVMIGQLRHDWERRQFSGAIDELAVYRRALTSKEVMGHFKRMGLGGNGEKRSAAKPSHGSES